VRVAIPELPTVPLDPTLAREVFTNLIENAVRYTPDDGRISIDAADASAAIVWSVTDTGIGIPKAQQEKIFEKFYRAGNAIEHSAEGSGLGLYLAKFIVNAWGGEISFVSEEGKGSTFRVTVPKAGMRAKEGHVSLNA
jgi:signal transduction histidine kinase